MTSTTAPSDSPTPDIDTIAAEGVLIAGGGRAILLQIAHPQVGLGVATHSDFASDPLRRLRHTLSYVYVQVFGSELEQQMVRDLVEAAHNRVAGIDDSGTPYSAHDPELQLWVAATLYDSAIRMHELVYGPLDDELAERVYRSYASLGTGLRMRAEQWPATRAAFADYWNEALTQLRVTPEARTVARALLAGTTLPVALRAAMPVGRLITAGTLPPALRSDYGLAWSSRHERRFRRCLSVIRMLYPHLPRWLRHWPKDHLMRGIRSMPQTG